MAKIINPKMNSECDLFNTVTFMKNVVLQCTGKGSNDKTVAMHGLAWTFCECQILCFHRRLWCVASFMLIYSVTRCELEISLHKVTGYNFSMCFFCVIFILLCIFCLQKYAMYYLKFLLQPIPPADIMSSKIKMGQSSLYE